MGPKTMLVIPLQVVSRGEKLLRLVPCRGGGRGSTTKKTMPPGKTQDVVCLFYFYSSAYSSSNLNERHPDQHVTSFTHFSG